MHTLTSTGSKHPVLYGHMYYVPLSGRDVTHSSRESGVEHARSTFANYFGAARIPALPTSRSQRCYPSVNLACPWRGSNRQLR